MATEKRLIDAVFLEDRVRISKERNSHIDFLSARAHYYEHELFLRMIRSAPTVDAVEVVHGWWEFSHTTTVEKYDVVKCSNCGHEAFAIAIYVKEGHYCPNCGAKMDGDRNGI